MEVDFPSAFDAEGEPSKFLARMKRRVAKDFRWTRLVCLQSVMLLAYWLHVFGRNDEALEVCRFLAQAEFTGNCCLWDSIEAALALQSRLLRHQGSQEEADECVDRIRSTSFLETRLDGVILQTLERNVQAAIDDATRTSQPRERDWRLLSLTETCILIELGGSSALPASALEERYFANVRRLREMVNLPPFC
jgi:hypothetical protein